MNICEELGILKTTFIFKNIFEILVIVVPLILIVLAMVDLGKIVISNGDNYSKAISIVVRRFVAAVAVFCVPTIIMATLSFVSENTIDAKKIICWNEANTENIEKIELALEAEKEREREEYEKEKEEIEKSKVKVPSSDSSSGSSGSAGISASRSLAPIVNGTQRGLKEGECMSASDNCYCPTVGKFNGFYFTMATATGRNMSSVTRTGGESMVRVKVECSDGTYISKTVNSKAKENFEQAFEKICKLKTTGINGIKISESNLHIDGTLVERTTSSRQICSPHAYGVAIDINYDLTITVNGVNYKPYASQGSSTKKAYDSFVSAIGSESDKRNVNYILWKYAFEPSGFAWGGNWSEGSYDPMHYEIAM